MAAGPITLVADIVKPEVYAQYIQQQTEVKSRFVMSGAVQSNMMLSQLLTGGGLTFHIPSWQDLADDADRVATDTITDSYTGGTIAPTPFKLSTSDEVAVRLSRNASWATADLAADLAGSDPVMVIMNRMMPYWQRAAEAALIATITGVFADNAAAPSGSEHVQDDMTVDISGSGFTDGVTNFSAESLIDAELTLGDSMDDLALIVMHSVPYARMRKNDLIDFIPDSMGAMRIPTFLGKEVIVDDRIPKSSSVYDTWLFGRGAVQMGVAPARVPFAAVREEGAGNGQGADVIYSRMRWCFHPVGNKYAGTAANGGPSNASSSNNLAAAGSWARVYPERKQIKIARLITREA